MNREGKQQNSKVVQTISLGKFRNEQRMEITEPSDLADIFIRRKIALSKKVYQEYKILSHISRWQNCAKIICYTVALYTKEKNPRSRRLSEHIFQHFLLFAKFTFHYKLFNIFFNYSDVEPEPAFFESNPNSKAAPGIPKTV